MSEKTTTPAVRPMPTATDVPEIREIAQAHSGSNRIYEVLATSGGVLVRHDRTCGESPAPALEAVGYSTVVIRQGLVLVTGAVDPIALLDAQIAALQTRRADLLEKLTGAPF
ncbi:hypothetical protein ABZ799_28900 [Nocardiopsis dassonvillei]|uniref:hypothetical protein n=1 Tax=Nocardiopsis dassonvillei TaxID=2014 RepID=UPI0033ED13B6